MAHGCDFRRPRNDDGCIGGSHASSYAHRNSAGVDAAAAVVRVSVVGRRGRGRGRCVVIDRLNESIGSVIINQSGRWNTKYDSLVEEYMRDAIRADGAIRQIF